MNKFKFLTVAFAAILFFSCSSKQIGLKENWIDERDVMALRDIPIKEWIEKAGFPTLVEIVGDTSIYYYNYRPTLYATTLYDSTTFFKTWGSVSEQKPSLANKTEVWGSRRDVMQIKVVNELVISATITEGPDKKVFVRDLNGNIVLDPNSGYNPNISGEQKVNSSFKDFSKIFSSLHSTPAPKPADSAAKAEGTEKILWKPPENYLPKSSDSTAAHHPADSAAVHSAAAVAHPGGQPHGQTQPAPTVHPVADAHHPADSAAAAVHPGGQPHGQTQSAPTVQPAVAVPAAAAHPVAAHPVAAPAEPVPQPAHPVATGAK